MNIAEWTQYAGRELALSGCPDPQTDARWIAEDTLSMSRTELKFEGERAVTDGQLALLNDRLSRRCAGEPLQYILQSASFMGLEFYVDRRVLIPRQDTETLVEQALILLRQLGPSPAVLDLCTGSGCVGLSLKSLVPEAEVTLSDISADALDVARKNSHDLGLPVTLRHGDLLQAVGRARFDLIVSNPPYVRSDELPGLQREVQQEPALALDGGYDGLDFYRRIAEQASGFLNPGGAVCLEVGIDEAPAALDLLLTHLDVRQSGVERDLNGVERVVWARIAADGRQ